MIPEKFVRRAVIIYLQRKGWGRNLHEKETHEQGVDFTVYHNDYPRKFLVECKGEADPKSFKYPKSGNENSFVIALGQIVSRMETNALYWYGIAFPVSFRDRATRRVPWNFARRNRLKIFFVNKVGKVEEIDWKKLKQIQKRPASSP